MKKIVFAFVALIFSLSAFSFESQQIDVKSPSMDRTLKTTVVLPDSYQEGDKHYSTIYVLHGWSGDHLDWVNKSNIEVLADQYQVILVLPDGDFDKWYIDSPVNPKSRFETFVSTELVDAIDKQYRTIPEKNGRAITGLSMGGFGALNIALNHQDQFGAVGSMSGGVEPKDFPMNWGLTQVFGDPVDNAKFWNEKSIINSAHHFIFSDIAIIVDCGTDDFFIHSNRKLHKTLLDLKVPHNYIEREGGHNWDYWDNSIKYQMLFLTDALTQKQKATQ